MSEFEKEWEHQIGSLMLKTENEGREWKKVVARHFWDRGQQNNDCLKRAVEKLEDIVSLNKDGFKKGTLKISKEGVLPCPFCESDDVLYITNECAIFGGLYAKILCNGECASIHIQGMPAENALELWNNRPIEDELRAENKKLREDFASNLRITLTLKAELEKLKLVAKFPKSKIEADLKADNDKLMTRLLNESDLDHYAHTLEAKLKKAEAENEALSEELGMCGLEGAGMVKTLQAENERLEKELTGHIQLVASMADTHLNLRATKLIKSAAKLEKAKEAFNEIIVAESKYRVAPDLALIASQALKDIEEKE